jgi:hypothetical protein
MAEIIDADFKDVECDGHEFVGGRCVNCNAPETVTINVGEEIKTGDKFGN